MVACTHDKAACSTVTLVCPICEPDRHAALLEIGPYIGKPGNAAFYLNLAVGHLRSAREAARHEGKANQHQLIVLTDTIEALLDILCRDYPEFWGPYERDGNVAKVDANDAKDSPSV